MTYNLDEMKIGTWKDYYIEIHGNTEKDMLANEMFLKIIVEFLNSKSKQQSTIFFGKSHANKDEKSLCAGRNKSHKLGSAQQQQMVSTPDVVPSMAKQNMVPTP